MASFLITCLSATARKPPPINPVIPNTTKSTVMTSTSNNFFCPPPNRCVSGANPSLLSKSTSLFLQTPLKHKRQDSSKISSVAASPSDLTQVSATLCFSLADLLDAIETDSEEEVEVEEEENLIERWSARETEDGVEIKINLPGLSKEDVHVNLEETNLLIKAGKAAVENEKPVAFVNGDKTDEENDMMMISFELDLDFLKLNEMKAEMKNGVLKIFIPKIIEEKEEKLVMDIKVE